MSVDVLQRPALVLNRHWQPIHVTTVIRAVVMLWNGTARAVETDGFQPHDWETWATLEAPANGPALRTGRRRVRVPEVVCLERYERVPGVAVPFSRRNLARRDHYMCQYCGVQPGGDRITIDHVVPRSQGGPSNWTNCVVACVACNARKGNRTPEQAGMRLRARPVRPDWRPLLAGSAGVVPAWRPFLGEAAGLAQTPA